MRGRCAGMCRAFIGHLTFTFTFPRGVELPARRASPLFRVTAGHYRRGEQRGVLRGA